MQQDNNTGMENAKAAETALAVVVSNTMQEAADMLGVDRSTVYRRIDRYKLNDVIDSVPERALKTLKIGSVAAAEEFIDQLRHRDVGVRREAAKEILDRVGVGTKDGPVIAQQINTSGDMQVEFIDYEET